jgi:Holliday junction resolvase RusA-like endonuclease
MLARSYLKVIPTPEFRPTPSQVDPYAQVYVVQGDPVPLARARSSGNRMYDSQKNIKQFIRISLEGQHNQQMYKGPVILDIRFYLELPKRKMHPHHTPLGPHFFKPDLSNLIKMYEDVCTGLLLQDDAQIATIIAHKYYDYVPRTEFSIIEIK